MQEHLLLILDHTVLRKRNVEQGRDFQIPLSFFECTFFVKFFGPGLVGLFKVFDFSLG